ncbi:MAG: hypothetical protein WAN11_28160 [Syntrophobacteraceae bacterium]
MKSSQCSSILCEIIVILLFFIFSPSLAIAAQVDVIDGRYEGEKYVSIRGEIAEGDAAKVQQAAKTAIQQGNNTLALLLSSGGGDIVEAMKIGRFARELLATTYVYGNTLYLPNTPDGAQLEKDMKTHSQTRFHLRPVINELGKDDVVQCYSACVLILYGGVNRYVSDNNDFRNGIGKMKQIPVIGIHRPYFDKVRYASFSPDEAKNKYKELEELVRKYMQEMGAPTSIIDRMFRTASNNVDLIPAEQFKEFYHSKEPFFDEWLLAKCSGYGGTSALTAEEQREYADLEKHQKEAFMSGHISSDEIYSTYAPPGMTRERAIYLNNKIKSHNDNTMACRESAVELYQSQWVNSH